MVLTKVSATGAWQVTYTYKTDVILTIMSMAGAEPQTLNPKHKNALNPKPYRLLFFRGETHGCGVARCDGANHNQSISYHHIGCIVFVAFSGGGLTPFGPSNSDPSGLPGGIKGV